MTAYRLSQLAPLLGEPCHLGGADTLVRHLGYDSRIVYQGGQTLFFALKSPRNDGHRYLLDAAAKGVRSFVLSDHKWIEPLLEACAGQADVFMCPNPLAALQTLAAWHRGQMAAQAVAVTGSRGKTIVKEWLADLLPSDGSVWRSPKSYNSQLGVPLAVWGIDPRHRLAVIEAGTTLPGELERLLPIVQPQGVVITNLSQSHLQGFGTIEEKARQYFLIAQQADWVVYRANGPTLSEAGAAHQKSHPHCRHITWTTEGQAATWQVQWQTQGTATQAVFTGNGAGFSVTLPFADAASLENATHVVVAAHHLGVAPDTLAERSVGLRNPAMRLEIIEGASGCKLLYDTYANDLSSLNVALQTLSVQLPPGKTLILGKLADPMLPQEELYAEAAANIAKRKLHRLILLDDAARFADLFRPTPMCFPTPDDLLNALPGLHIQNEAVLVKGQTPGLSKLVQRLSKQSHQTVLEINLTALQHNFHFFRSLLEPQVKTMAMVKAFSYGSGPVEVSRLMQQNGADYLAVAYVDEGKQLREEGISLPIMVMNPTVEDLPAMARFGLEPEIYSIRLLESVAASGQPHSIHIKVDTGMRRLGFEPEQAGEIVRILKNASNIQIKSIFSHLAAADEPEYDDFTREQLAVYTRFCLAFEMAGISGFMRHVANTAGLLRFPQAHFDMVRLGIGLYGVDPTNTVQGQLRLAVALKGAVSQVRRLEAGQTIGYGRRGRLDGAGRVAIVSLGYADGFSRRLGNGRGRVYLHGQAAPITGNVCMDMCMADVSHIPAVQEGDVATVFETPEQLLHLSEALGTIPYEVLSMVSARVRRVYWQE